MALFSNLRSRFQQRPVTAKLGGGGLTSQPLLGQAGDLNRQRLATRQSMQQSKQVNQKLAQQQASSDSVPKPEMGGGIPKTSPPSESFNPPVPTFQSDQLKAMQESLAKLSGDVGKFQPPTSQPTPVTQPTSNEDLEKFLGLLKPTSEEEATKKQLANILASRELGLTNLEGEPIPLSAALGETGRIERRAQAMATPLQERLANLQQQRQAELQGRQFLLERGDTQAERERKAREPISVSEGETLYDPTTGKSVFQGKEKAITPQREVVTVGNRQILIDKTTGKTIADLGSAPLTAAEKEAALAGGGKAGAGEQLNLARVNIENARKLAHAAGRSGIRRTAEGLLVGATDFTNLEQSVKSLGSIMLTMATDPSIKKFFGPQMSNADVQQMIAAGTTLSAENQRPETLLAELDRLDGIIGKLEGARGAGGQQVGGQQGDPLGVR